MMPAMRSVSSSVTRTFADGPRVCVFVNSGSEATDIGWRMAKMHGGKSGANDANAEFLGSLRRILDKDGVIWQPGGLGKVDEGGGGTIAFILARYGMQVVDIGVPLLSMHAPIEIASKVDLFMAYRAYKAFFRDC